MAPITAPPASFLTEIAHSYETFKQQGYTIDVVSIKGGEAPLDGMHEKEEALNIAFLTGDGLQKMQHTLPLAAVHVADYDAAFVPGDLAPHGRYAGQSTAARRPGAGI